MKIQFYNTLDKQIQQFKPLQAPDVYMYNCGPTVYDFAHIGNFRTFVFADVLRRFLELAGYQVHQVMNITDVGHMTEDQLADGGGEDKMQVALARLKATKKEGSEHEGAVADPSDPYQVADYYARAFIDDARKLRLKIADDPPEQMPRATAHVGNMVAMIQKLIANEHAYVAEDGAVYYSVLTFPDYGKLSGNDLEQLRGGASGRISDAHQVNKRHRADFLLWKPDNTHLMKWDSPWGVGYPGWHIECSAMATAVLGRQVIDIHTGGEDNIMPHHECEIAQSRGVSGQSHFAKLWMHSRFLLVEGQKMSKSKGNFYTLGDLLSQGIDPCAIRFELLKAHYRSNANFTQKGIEDSASAVSKLRNFQQTLTPQAGEAIEQVDLTHPTVHAFASALADDLNMAGALGVVFGWLHEKQHDAAVARGVLQKIDSVLGVLNRNCYIPSEPWLTTFAAGDEDAEVIALCRSLDEARKNKDYEQADTLRKQLVDQGYDVKTSAQGTVATKRLA